MEKIHYRQFIDDELKQDYFFEDKIFKDQIGEYILEFNNDKNSKMYIERTDTGQAELTVHFKKTKSVSASKLFKRG